MNALSRQAIKHRWWVIAGWIAAIVLIQFLSSSIGGATYKDNFSLPGTEAQTVSDLLAKNNLLQQGNETGTLVLHAKGGTLAAEPERFLAGAKTAVCADKSAHIVTITTPWGTADCATPTAAGMGGARPGLLSPDKSVALVEVAFDVHMADTTMAAAVYNDMKTLRSATLQIEFTSDIFSGVDSSTSALNPLLLGFAAALIILALVLRTFGATVLPLLTAGVALGCALGLTAILSHGMSVASFSPNLAELMVIGVGVDYALFIVTRHRRNLQRGMNVNESITNAVNTAGRAVLFAGLTVCTAILGLCVLGVSFFYGVAVSVSIGVALTMAASLTLLPALLSLLGRRALPRSRRQPLPSDKRVKILLCVVPPLCALFWVLYALQWALRPAATRLAARRAKANRSVWTVWANLVQRRSLIFGVLAGALIVLIAVPFFSLRLGHPDQSSDPAGSTTRKGYDLIQTAYGKGYNSDLQLVVDGPKSADPVYLAKIDTTLAATPDVDGNSIASLPLTKGIAFVTFKSISGPQDAATDSLVRKLRADVLPPLYQGTDTKIYVSGSTATFIDFAAVVSAKMIYFILAVVGVSFLLLMIAFRSVLIPVTAAAMNLLAAGASFGVVVAIFQWGWFSDALGLGAGGPIDAFLPVLFFAILFGLSMDYQVFLISRMHEEWVHTRDNRRAVAVGQAETGGIITAAGVIMVAVFGGFILGDEVTIKQLGLGLASAVFLDAFIVRTMLVPALMHRLGSANWWYPAWLDKVTPRVSIEPPETDPAAQNDEGHQLIEV